MKKIENVKQLINNSFSLMPNGEWTSEAADVLKSNKATLQLEIIEFQEDVVLKKFMLKFQKLLRETNFGLKCAWKKVSRTKSFSHKIVYYVWLNLFAWSSILKNELH